MNKKNKNKNRSKPVNPAPATETVIPEPVIEKSSVSAVPVEENLESSVKQSESVVETVSEVSVPIIEEHDLSSDTPKKPKRNKGKKKKQDEWDLEEGKPASIDVLPSVVTSEPNVEVKEQIKAETAETKVEEENVTPNVRKKKHKKKQNEERKVEDPLKEIEIIENVDDVKKEDIITGIQIEPETPRVIEPDTKQSKKKNKKKKHRHDSEKSDKTDEVVTCTSAFQNLISSKDNEDEIKSIEVVELAKDIIEEDKTLSSPSKEETFKELIESVMLVEDTQESEKIPAKGVPPKAKKKNKKDKQQHQKEGDEEIKITDASTIQEPCMLSITDIISAEITKDDIIKDEELLAPMYTENISTDTATKPKAKIAKPVEKKSKKKTESIENIDKKSENESIMLGSGKVYLEDEKSTENITTFSALVDTSIQKMGEILAVHESVNEDTNIIGDEPAESIVFTDEVSPSTEVPIIANITDMPENITDIKTTEKMIESDIKPPADQFISDKETDHSSNEPSLLSEGTEKEDKDTSSEVQSKKIAEKKKKKQPKQIDVICSIPKAEEVPENKILITPESEPKVEETSNKKIEELLLQPTPTDVDIVDFNIRAPVDKSLSDIQIDNSSLPTEVIEEQDKDISNDEQFTKTIEKKKKKHPKQINVHSDINETGKNPDHKILVTPESEPITQKTPDEQIEDLLFATSPGKLEISSLKTDDMVGSGSSDVTPDFIHHPLASSQHLLDDNNNMFIREVTLTDEKLGLPVIIPTEPIIQGSGETPEPESTVIGSTLIRGERSKTNESEKTDLKSKMMEVSQDMEELRLSIERSLAELTSMEKTEEEAEKRFKETECPPLGIVSASCSVQYDIMSEENKCKEENLLDDNKVTLLQNTDIKNEAFTENIKPQVLDLKSSIEQAESVKAEKIENLVPDVMDNQKAVIDTKEAPPIAPVRKDHKGKGKGKRKGKQEAQTQQTISATESTTTTTESKSQESHKSESTKTENNPQQAGSDQTKGKQQAMQSDNGCNGSDDVSHDPSPIIVDLSYEPIEHFEDALTSSVDDVNKTFEMIANDVNNSPELTFQNPEINIIAPSDETEAAKPKQNPVTPPKNLLGHPDIPVASNKTDYKKEKNKPPNMRQAKVKIKDAVDIEKIEKTVESKESQTENKKKLSNNRNILESFSYMTNENGEYVYKYSFRKVFLQSLCHFCRKELSQRVPCQFCSLVFYCSQKHKDEDWPQHQSLCFAVCTIVHLKDQKHIYADAKNITGHNYRLLRMQMIISCEKVLKRKLVPWEQEAFLYPRICADESCREWKQSKLTDCTGCGQVSYCSEHPDHLPTSHQRWCRSYALYQKLVHHQQTKGRLEPKLPTRIMAAGYRIPDKINEVLASMYDEKIDMTDAAYAALTQLATAPLTAAHCHQHATAANANGISKKTSFVIHIVGAELQFEADVLFKWEVFFLHLKPDIKELRVVLISTDLNPSNLPLDLLKNVNLCENCKNDNRRVLFSFQDKKTYYEYWSSDDFYNPDIVCTFNPSIQRSSLYNGKDTWPTTISCIIKLKTPFVVTSYSINELQRDVAKIRECSELSGINFKIISDPKSNPFASVRPDRNFITDDEIPLLFKNYFFAVLCGI